MSLFLCPRLDLRWLKVQWSQLGTAGGFLVVDVSASAVLTDTEAEEEKQPFFVIFVVQNFHNRLRPQQKCHRIFNILRKATGVLFL